jgi:hypothetical protein
MGEEQSSSDRHKYGGERAAIVIHDGRESKGHIYGGGEGKFFAYG